MKIHEIKIYLKLKAEPQTESSLKSILKTHYFKMLIETGTILRTAKGRGATYSILKPKEFEQFLNNHYTEVEGEESRITNAVKYNNSKIRSKGEQIILLRGFAIAEINNQQVDLEYHTNTFGLFSTQLVSLKAKKVCYVENLKCFLVAEKLLGKDFIFLHPYGRPSKELIQKLNIEQFLFAPDYDYTGLNDFLRCKKVLNLTELYFPNAEILKRAKREIKVGQKISKEVLNSTEENVKLIVEQLQKTNLFLEQEKLFYEG